MSYTELEHSRVPALFVVSISFFWTCPALVNMGSPSQKEQFWLQISKPIQLISLKD